jgi:hypothetical protein
VQATADYFAEEDAKTGDSWKLPRVMMWLQKKHGEFPIALSVLCCIVPL